MDLFDEEWLPILPEFYWNLDTAQGALTRAVASGDRFDTKNLLLERRFTTGDLDDALEWAASGMNPAMVRDLLAAGAHVNATSKSGYTPLMGAINNGRIEFGRAETLRLRMYPIACRLPATASTEANNGH